MPPKKKKNASKGKKSKQAAPQPIVISHKDLFPKGSFARAGGLLGSFLGPKGAALGTAAGAALSRITGVGDYKVKSNSIMTDTASFSGEVPHFGKTDNSTRVRHREFVTDVVVGATPSAFVNTSYVIQPSNSALFPWLSSLAQNYQQYRVHGMVFVFKSTTSDYSAAGALGKIAMATNYNVRDSNFASMQELENAEFSVSGKPSLSRVHPIECAPNNGIPLVKWVRDAQYDASGGDDRLYDIGKFQFATQGLPASTASAIIGELWVTYDIEFFKPIINRLPAQYQAVSVPVFDSFAGGATAGSYTNSLTMTELSGVEKPSGGWPDKATLLTAIRNPGKLARIAPTTYSGVASARITRSAYRAVPDPDSDPNGSYPAFWQTSDTLVLQRKGLYHLQLNVHQVQGSNQARNWPYNCQFLYCQPAVVPSTATAEQRGNMGHITVSGPEGNFQTIISHAQSTAWVFTQPNSEYVVSSGVATETLYPTGLQWDLLIWVKADHSAGNGVSVRFYDEVINSTDRVNNVGLQWNGSNDLNINMVDGVYFTVGYVSATQKTYYEPIANALTKDDESALKQSLASVEALLPKLRELGYV